nr:hypothetical protein [uncultured Pseudomonas sp.]
MDISTVNQASLIKLHQLPAKPLIAQAVEHAKPDDGEINTLLGEKPWLTEPGLECIDSVEEYISFKKMDAHISLGIMKIHYEAFIDRLSNTHPELANKNFSFTINDQGALEVLDPDNVLSSEERSYLKEQLNLHEGLTANAVSLQEIAKTLIQYGANRENGTYSKLSNNSHVRLDFLKLLKSEDANKALQEQISVRSGPRSSRISEQA